MFDSTNIYLLISVIYVYFLKTIFCVYVADVHTRRRTFFFSLTNLRASGSRALTPTLHPNYTKSERGTKILRTKDIVNFYFEQYT